MSEKPEPVTDLLRRRKVLFVTTHRLMGFLLAGQIKNTYACIPQLNLPENAMLTEMWLDHARGALGVMICHESYDIVPDGEEPPIQKFDYQVVELALRNLNEKP